MARDDDKRTETEDAGGKHARHADGKHTITRRGVIGATAAVGVTAAAIGIAVSRSGSDPNEDSALNDTPVVVDSDEGGRDILTSFSEKGSSYEATATYELPVGSVLLPAEGTWIPVMTAGESASPMVTASAFSASSGDVVQVLDGPVTEGSNIEIYQARCSDSVYAWVELDLLTRSWWLYAAPFSSGAISGNVVTLWSATSDWDPAPFCCTGTHVVWQVQPSLSGTKTAETSECYLWTVGDSEAQKVLSSVGRFAGSPTPSEGTVTVVPRVRNDEGTYYGITAYDVEDGFKTPIDQLVMPSTVKPFKAVRVGDQFAFSVEASYESGGLLGSMGYYVGTANDDDILYLSREPAADIACVNNTLLIKCRSFYYVVNLEEESYGYLAAVNRCTEYGEYPARVGTVSNFVTYSTVNNQDTGYPDHVEVRVFDFS